MWKDNSGEELQEGGNEKSVILYTNKQLFFLRTLLW